MGWTRNGAQRLSGDLDFGSCRRHRLRRYWSCGWMDHHLRGLDNSESTPSQPVRLFVMGENRWRSRGTPGRRRDAGPRTLYLAATAVRQRPSGALSLDTSHSSESAASRLGIRPRGHPSPIPTWSSVRTTIASSPERGGRRGPSTRNPSSRTSRSPGRSPRRSIVSCDCPDTDLWVRLLDVCARRQRVQPHESRPRTCRESQLSRPGSRPPAAARPATSYRLDLRESHDQQRVSAGPSDPGADLHGLCASLLPQSAHGRARNPLG